MLCSKHNHSRGINFIFQLNQLIRLDVKSNFVCYLPYCVSLITIIFSTTSPNEIYVTELREHISAVKFLMGNEKIMSFLLVSKS